MQTLEHRHSITAIRKRLAIPHRANYLRDWIYGGIDGSVTTFAIVSGAAGGDLSVTVIIILGLANLIADGFSMAASNYLGTKSEHDLYNKYKQIETKHTKSCVNGEKLEIRQIYINKGFNGKILDDIVETISKDKKLWVETMLQEEYGLSKNIRAPFKSESSTFFSFLLFGSIPLIPYIFGINNSFALASFFTVIAFFLIGSIKSFWSERSWLYSGFETTLLGTIAASLAYAIGYFLAGIA